MAHVLPRNVDPQRVLTVLFRRLSGDELQQLYDGYGRSAERLRAALLLEGVISKRRLARRLFERGVILHPTDMDRMGLSSGDSARLNDYQTFDLGDGFDPEAMMEEAVECDLDPSIFSDMDTRELPHPANFLEWVTGREFLNTTIFPRQVQLNLALFEEWCPYCSDREFVKNIHLSPHLGDDGYPRAWTMDEIRDRVTLYDRWRCLTCKKTYIDALNDPDAPHRFPKELDACVGQRAGKTRGAEHMMTKNEAEFHLARPNPQTLFGQDVAQKFSAIYTALQLSQAQDTLWGAYHLRVQTAPWFRTYHRWLDEHGRRLGVELYVIKETYHWYKTTGLHSVLRPPFAKEMRGRTGFQGGIDEIGMFAKKEGSIRANADEVHKSISNSLLTLRANADSLVRRGTFCIPRPALFCISSPWELLDKIMTLVRTADRDPTRVAFHYSTWEFNPTIRRDSPQMLAEFAENPVNAERDFGAIPPFAKDPFHNNPDIVDALITSGVQSAFRQKIKHMRTTTGDHYVYAVPAHLRPDKSTPRMIIIDAGESDNSFAIGLYRLIDLPAPLIDVGGGADDFDDLIFDEDDEDIRVVLEAARGNKNGKTLPAPVERGKVTYLQPDGLIEVQPFTDRERGVEYRVSFTRMWENCLKPMLEAFNIVMVGADRWNITQIGNSITEMGIPFERWSLTWQDFRDFKDKVDRREVRLPSLEKPFEAVYDDYEGALRDAPNLHLCVQLKTVRQVGRTVAKPSGGTDDIYRTLVLAHRFCFSEKAVRVVDGKETTYFELMHTFGKGTEKPRRVVSVVMVRGQGGAGGQTAGQAFSRVGGYASRGSGGGGSYSNVATRGGNKDGSGGGKR